MHRIPQPTHYGNVPSLISGRDNLFSPSHSGQLRLTFSTPARGSTIIFFNRLYRICRIVNEPLQGALFSHADCVIVITLEIQIRAAVSEVTLLEL